jgi:hypothetical protein
MEPTIVVMAASAMPKPAKWSANFNSFWSLLGLPPSRVVLVSDDAMSVLNTSVGDLSAAEFLANINIV